ncbi:MAG: uroporphyrinogen-III synthase [Pyrinomonadaceae bacterium]|nr:uroporphyrinogen-III synthase [Pyrinomonadaceae bacterium]
MPTVLVVRKFDNFSRILQENGFSVVNLPTIETVEIENSADLNTKIAAKNYDGIFLTSQKATEIAEREIFSKQNYGGKVYVLGRKSFDTLKDKNILLSFDETANTAQEMLEKITLDELKDKKFLFIRGERSLGKVKEFLKKIASLDEEIVYETHKIVIEDSLKIEIEAKRDEIVFVCFFSPSGAESFLEQFGEKFLEKTKIAVIGRTTADFFGKQNLEADFIAKKASAEDFAVELVDYLRKEAEASA